jgi:hypothetical protein
MNVIDIGCGPNGRSFDDYIPDNWNVTGIDVIDKKSIQHKHPRFQYLQQSAQDLSWFEDRHFDMAISIGMLEHITEKSVFDGITNEIKRIAKQYIIVVPYRYCWIEPHYGFPFFPILPYSIKLSIVKRLNLSNHRDIVIRDPQYINKNYRWLSNAEYQKIFPDSHIYMMPTLETIAIIRASSL